MDIAEFVSPESITLLRSRTKDEALREMVEAMCTGNPSLDSDVVYEAILKRESTISSWISPGIAIPHARLPGLGEFVVGVGRSREGVAYDSVDGKPVHLFFMILGDERQPDRHILLLAGIARLLKESEVQERLLSATSEKDILEVIRGSRASMELKPAMSKNALSRMIVHSALSIAEKVRARAILIHAEAMGAVDVQLDETNRDRVVLILSGERAKQKSPDGFVRTLVVPFPELSRAKQVEVALLFGVTAGHFDRGDTVVSVSGAPGSGYLDTLRVIDVDSEFSPYLSDDTSTILGDIEPQVMERIIQIAMDISREGREGRPIGTIFVLGDYRQVVGYCQQMVINPFRGYNDDEKSIIDPLLEETIKEFASIDGAFVIRGDGVVMAAGVYLKHGQAGTTLPSGFGARHTAAAATTAVTSAVSVVISQSTATVTVFKNGKPILVLDKTRS